MFVNDRMKITITIKIICRYLQYRNVLIITATNIYTT